MEATNTSPLEKDGKKLKRKYLGGLTSAPFDKAHLKAYLKGWSQFIYGYETVSEVRQKKYHTVQQEYSYV